MHVNRSQHKTVVSGGTYINPDISRNNVIFYMFQVRRLEAQIHNLSESQVKTDQRHLRLKEENTTLVER